MTIFSNFRQFFLTNCLLFIGGFAIGQSAVPRFFLDAPEIYVNAPNVNRNKSFDRAGLGVSAAMNVASYNGTIRGGGYFGSTVRPQEKELQEATVLHYGAFFETGLGMYRSNGNRCAKDFHGAYTAMVVGGLRMDLDNKAVRAAGVNGWPNGFDYTVGAELGYFYIKDILRNTEFTLRGDYFFKQEVIGVRLGMKIFWNLKSGR